jgi:hypothetical protein
MTKTTHLMSMGSLSLFCWFLALLGRSFSYFIYT